MLQVSTHLHDLSHAWYGHRLMKLMREMFGAQSVRWSANLLEEKIEISVDSSTAVVDANTLVGVVRKMSSA